MITSDFFFSLNNPFIFSILLGITLAVFLFLIHKHIFKPLKNKHRSEKESLELKNSRLMAMFAELDPSPLFRFDITGKIIFCNESGYSILNELNLAGAAVYDFIPLPGKINYEKFINEGSSCSVTAKLGEDFYDMIIKGIPETGFGQIYCNNITRRKKSEEELENSQQKLRELSVHIQKIQEEEKRKISRELHDNFGQIIASVKMNIDRLSEKSKDDSLSEEFSGINVKLEEARKEIRELSYQLRPRVLDDFGLEPALKMLCEDVSKRTGIKGLFKTYNFTERLKSDTETNIYRIVQEALNNIAKHSKASEFNVQIVKNPDNIIVSIEDDGKGFNSSARNNSDIKGGMGMINMSERALSFNGKFFISSEPGRGTEIIIEIPFESINGKN